MTYPTTPITDFGQELYVKKEALAYLDQREIEYARTDLDRACMDELLHMLKHGVRLAVKYERVIVDDIARGCKVYSHRMQVDEVRTLKRGITMFERCIGDYKRLPSVVIPPPFYPPKPVQAPLPSVVIPPPFYPPKPVQAPWHKQLKTFLKQAWDDTGKITGCKL